MKIQHKTLNDRAYDAIRSSLITSDFKPGQVLVIRSLAETYGISATPVREALQRLVAERLLTMLPNRSVAVPQPNYDDFLELTEIRVALEGLAAALATPAIKPAELARLHTLLAELQASIQRRDLRAYIALNQRLHFTIYEHAGAQRLLGMIRDLWSQIGPFLNTLFDGGDYVGTANDEHRRLVAAIEAGDAHMARAAIADDIRGAARALISSLDQQAGPASTRGSDNDSDRPVLKAQR
jgi:DNA-binding GntR family transcriptional regulator